MLNLADNGAFRQGHNGALFRWAFSMAVAIIRHLEAFPPRPMNEMNEIETEESRIHRFGRLVHTDDTLTYRRVVSHPTSVARLVGTSLVSLAPNWPI